MQFKTIFRILGILLMMFSLSMLPPVLVEMVFRDSSSTPYIIAFFLTFITGFILWLAFRHEIRELKIRDGFLIVVLFWFVLCFFAAIPLMISPKPHDNFTDAMFESVSGFTTTGATVVTDVDSLPHAMRYYRQQLQFLGGMGIVVLAVAILPMLGVGGMQLYRAETPGPIKDSKLTPRITETAKTLWYIYVGLTVCCGVSYWLAGMSAFDALGESFSTVATGGFSMHDSSFAYYNSNTIELIGAFFMFLGGTNFSLHFIALKKRNFLSYKDDEEFRTYVQILVVTILFVAYVIIYNDIYDDNYTAVVKSIFNVVSLATTTGFVSGSFASWPSFIPILIMIVATIGGCAASTSGGIKVMRALLLKKQTGREIHRLIHPRAVIAVKFNKQTLPDNITQAMWAFIAAFIVIFVILLLLLMADGMNLMTAFGASVASLANAGAAIGNVATSFQHVDVFSKWVLMLAMLAGRLEIFTLLVLFTPAYWQR